MNKYYGVKSLAEVLKETTSKMVFENQLNSVLEFSVLKEMPYETIVSIIDWMISEHFILNTKGKYPMLQSTYDGLHYSEKITVEKLKNKKYLEEEVIIWNQ